MPLSRVDGILLYFKEENILFTGRHCSPIYALIFIESSTCTKGFNKYLKMEFSSRLFLYANLTLFYYIDISEVSSLKYSTHSTYTFPRH